MVKDKKVRLIRITLARFIQMLANGEYHLKIENGLNAEDKLFHCEFNQQKQAIDFFYWSETGVELIEGQLLDNIEPNSPIFTDCKRADAAGIRDKIRRKEQLLESRDEKYNIFGSTASDIEYDNKLRDGIKQLQEELKNYI